MKKWTLILFPLLGMGLYTSPAYSASFDCNKASTYVERAICNNPQLSRLDDELAVHYAAEMSDANDNVYDYTEQKRDEQLHWLIFQRNTCKDEACLIREYKERLGDDPKFQGEWGGGDDIKPKDLPSHRAFGAFSRPTRISVYNPDAKDDYNVFNETNSVDIFSVTNKPYLAVIDSTMIFNNAHICTISDELATWSGNYWTLSSYELDKPAELRLYPATYKGKPQVLLRDMNNQYRRLNCGMRGYFDGLILEKKN